MQEICGFKTELPLGSAAQGGSRVRDFEVLKSGWEVQQLQLDEALQSARPHEWLARMLCLILRSIGDASIRQVYDDDSSKRIPPAVLALPLTDVGYIFALGHMYTFGPKIDVGAQQCPHCRRSDRYKLNLRSLVVDPSKHPDPGEFIAQLPTGWVDPIEADERRRLPHQGKTWNRLILRPATLGDAINNQNYLTQLHAANFELRLYSECTLRVESWESQPAADPDDPPDQTVKLDELDIKVWQMKMYSFIPSLDGNDHVAIRRAERGLPQVKLGVKHACNNCGRDIDTAIRLGSFFLMV